ncbi:exodeoxyribonuclease III [Microbacterium amylolyticum]|uniref:Exodeoxyribonuclease-3 n=1 Tax=Microbacterium amylolyticum TaxID=936337 RepID=A0ABS4ZJZ7_9MICO|nr:exodeoxyribonuclease III [Microbacterium amylolyticum]MBP2437522.1 exodeoxyribonuclease-3 [Microbacterium amylolyticum]
MTRIASVNVNGIRAAARKGMNAWLDSSDVDILTIQEVRGTREHLESLLPGWHVLEHESPQKGRAGVAIASREPAVAHRTDLGIDPLDADGRWLEADFAIGSDVVTVVSAYVHSGEADTPKQEQKWSFLDAMTVRLPQLADGGLAVVTGDLNVGHREFDIKNWRGNRKKSGFLPRERAYFDRWLAPLGQQTDCVDGTVGTGLGFVDVGRTAAGEVDGPYTWWSNRGQAFDNDTGWRIDYHLATPSLAERVEAYRVDRYPSYDTRWSDHAPVVVDYRLG